MRFVSSVLLSLVMGGCAAGTPAADAPQDEKSEAGDESSSSSDAAEGGEDEASDAASDSASDSDSGEAEEESSESGAIQRLLTQEGTAFVRDFSKSDAGIKTAERCEKSSKGDPAKKANCLNNATKKVVQQGFRFERDKADPEAWWFVRFEIKNTKPAELNRVRAAFVGDSGKKITIKTQGPDKAARRRGTVPASFEIDVPDEYTLIIEEAGQGKVVYEPKLGLFDGEPAR